MDPSVFTPLYALHLTAKIDHLFFFSFNCVVYHSLNGLFKVLLKWLSRALVMAVY